MSDNPYAAPEVASHLADPETHVQAVRSVSRFLRGVGWIGIVMYGTISFVATISLVYEVLLAEPDWVNPMTRPSKSTLVTVGVVLGHGGMAYIGWLFVRTGRRLLNGHRSAYRDAMLLSILTLCAFPLAPLGIYSIVQLRRHWRAYYDELTEASAEADSA
jgi:hypothetical protein